MHGKRVAKDIVLHVKKNYSAKVKKVTISLGELAGISKEELDRALKAEAAWNFSIVSERNMIGCLCGYQGPARISDKGHDYVMYECPQCGSPLPKPLKGHEIKVVKVEKI